MEMITDAIRDINKIVRVSPFVHAADGETGKKTTMKDLCLE